MNNIIHSSKFPSLAPSPDPTVIRDYSQITNYIQERIEKLEHDIETGTGWQSTKARYGIVELQAVLSKIEELRKADSDFVKNCERFMGQSKS